MNSLSFENMGFFQETFEKKAGNYATIIICKRYQLKGELVIVIFLMYDAFKQSLE
ncbi:hypothetical protein [Paenibacillus jilunlii]|uniref:hypothetical protein n=1 Tax=Paenibacillus jilunlii TaxID=682956 RepID=UPI000A977DEE|nr:hypothetical protein [Paenibacillus jilunlii]